MADRYLYDKKNVMFGLFGFLAVATVTQASSEMNGAYTVSNYSTGEHFVYGTGHRVGRKTVECIVRGNPRCSHQPTNTAAHPPSPPPHRP